MGLSLDQLKDALGLGMPPPEYIQWLHEWLDADPSRPTNRDLLTDGEFDEEVLLSLITHVIRRYKKSLYPSIKEF